MWGRLAIGVALLTLFEVSEASIGGFTCVYSLHPLNHMDHWVGRKDGRGPAGVLVSLGVMLEL